MAASVPARFPFINLEKSIGRAKVLFDADQRGRPMRISDAFTLWGYSDKSSGGYQTVSALKHYGLVEDHGANDDRKLNLTDLAVRYFLDEREEERQKLLQHFALMPKFIGAIWEQWEGKPPADSLARSELKLDFGLNDQSARSFLGIYKDNLSFASLAQSELISEVRRNEQDEAATQRTDAQDLSSSSKQQLTDDPTDVISRPSNAFPVEADERELTSGLLSKHAKFRLLVSGPIGPREVQRLIAKLELDKEILADEESEDGLKDLFGDHD